MLRKLAGILIVATVCTATLAVAHPIHYAMAVADVKACLAAPSGQGLHGAGGRCGRGADPGARRLPESDQPRLRRHRQRRARPSRYALI